MSVRTGPYDRRPGRNTHQRRDPPQPSRSPPPSILAPPNSTMNRNILVIVDFTDLAHLAHPSRNHAHYFRMLHPRYYDPCSAFESEALYTYCSLLLARDVHAHTISMLIGSLVEHILNTFLVEVDPATIELRFTDRDGDVFQVPRNLHLLELLASEFPMWRSTQQGVFRNEPIGPDIDYPFIARFSCHVSEPGVILP